MYAQLDTLTLTMFTRSRILRGFQAVARCTQPATQLFSRQRNVGCHNLTLALQPLIHTLTLITHTLAMENSKTLFLAIEDRYHHIQNILLARKHSLTTIACMHTTSLLGWMGDTHYMGLISSNVVQIYDSSSQSEPCVGEKTTNT